MRVQYGLSSYSRGRGDLPELPVINMFTDEAPTEERGVCLQSRPGLADRGAGMGTDPVNSLFKADGVLGGDLFGVAGGVLYHDTALVDVIGMGPVSWGGYADRVFVTAGAYLYSYDGAVLSPVAFPDGGYVTAIAVGSSRLLAIAEDSQVFYWSDSLTGDIDGLSFASAESSPDRLRDLLYIDDAAILFGAETIEFWPNTGNNDLPFQPLEGRVIERGIRNTGACCHIGGSFAWVTNDSQVCVQSEDNVISNTGLQARIEASTACELFRFTLEGNEFIALRLDNETQVYSRRSGMWSEFQTYDMANWEARCWAGGIFGGAGGKTLEWGSGHSDTGATMLERRFRAGVPLNSGGFEVFNAGLRCDVGNTPFLSGDYANPVVEMRVSRDNGNTWGTWKRQTRGIQGEYRKNVQWRALGMASRPGWIGEFRVVDPAPFRVSDVYLNEPYGGRP